MEYLDSEGRDLLSDDLDPSDELLEEDDALIELEDFEGPEGLDPDEELVEDEPA